eukprot:gene14972-6127_t
MAEEMQFFAESIMRGYHVYYKDVEVFIGKILFCEVENDNEFDDYAVALKTEDGELAGHVPIELSKVFTEFLQNYGEIEAECIGLRYNSGEGKGMQLPIDYRFIGNVKYLKNLRKELKQLKLIDASCVLKNITAIEISMSQVACHKRFCK